MRFVTVMVGDRQLAAVETGSGVIALSDLSEELPETVLDVIRAGEPALRLIKEAIGRVSPKPVSPGSYTLLAPIPRPAKNIFCVGKNYVEHAKEFQNSGFDQSSSGQEVPDLPIVFTKASTSVTGPDSDVDSRHDAHGTLDYEGEVGVIIGTGGRGISKEAAYDHVFGYTVINDVTARQAQNEHKQWFLGKSPDTFCPMGPCIVTADEIGDVTKLKLTTRVNGEVRQDAVVQDLIFDIPTIIETISRAITLEPGDIIATGTPVGVGIGFKPPKYLQAGDVMQVSITGMGLLENRIA
jgi:2-keto-4-pentenoate hydratase/2-oxohepta-3-ene-1,7-dioic acid hydratase in catechol pathway